MGHAQVKNILFNMFVIAFIFGPGIAGTIIWWFTGKDSWLLGWVWALIAVLAG